MIRIPGGDADKQQWHEAFRQMLQGMLMPEDVQVGVGPQLPLLYEALQPPGEWMKHRQHWICQGGGKPLVAEYMRDAWRVPGHDWRQSTTMWAAGWRYITVARVPTDVGGMPLQHAQVEEYLRERGMVCLPREVWADAQQRMKEIQALEQLRQHDAGMIRGLQEQLTGYEHAVRAGSLANDKLEETIRELRQQLTATREQATGIHHAIRQRNTQGIPTL